MPAEGRATISLLFFVEGGIDGWFLAAFQERVFCTQAVKGVLSVETVLEEEGAFALTDVNSIAVTVHTYKNDVGETSAFDFYP